jgi:tartrate-resistant acid phosphatase type 5
MTDVETGPLLSEETIQKSHINKPLNVQEIFTRIILPSAAFCFLLFMFSVACIVALIIMTSDPFSKPEFNYIIIGDWGTGLQSQLAVANGMDKVSNDVNYDFVISTGDHFYWQGIDNSSDPLINAYYESVYNKYVNLNGLNWHLCLGNHDYIRNPIAQIEYSSINKYWNLPSKRYTKEFFLKGHVNVQFIFMDTSPYSELERSRTPKLRNENFEEQTAWLRTVLENGQSRYKWRFVVGHHPFYSSGTYGDFGHENMTNIEAIFNEFKIDAYFNGHQHILEHTQTTTNGYQMNYFTSGAGGQTISNHIVNQNHTNSKFVLGKTTGFMTQQLLPDKATTKIHDQDGKIVYEFTIIKR